MRDSGSAASSHQPSGRLELTWVNKQLRLLAREDTSYEWTGPSDYRVSEVRLLHNVAAHGDVGSEQERAQDNLLIRGDALHALNSVASTHEFRDNYLGRIKLCYIDPPFNTGQAFEFAQVPRARDFCAEVEQARRSLASQH